MSADNLKVSDFVIAAGEEKQIAIELLNPDRNYVAFQFDMTLPEGVTIAVNNKGKLVVSLNEDRLDDHSMSVENIGSNTYRFVSFSLTNAEYYGTSGALIDLTVKAADDIASGTKTATINNLTFTDKNAKQYSLQNVSYNITVSGDVGPTDVSTLTDAIYAEPASGLKGGDGILTICLKNEQATNAYSFDLKLPAGVTLAKDGDDDYIYTLSTRHNGHSPSVNYNETTDRYSFAVLSLSSKEIKDKDGAIWTLKLRVADDMAVGSYAVTIQNAKYSLTSGSTSVILPDVTSLLTIEDYTKGDANGDTSVDIADAVCIVNHVVGKATPTFIEAAADANGDGVVDIADAVRIVNLVVGKIPALAPRRDWRSMLEPE